MEPLRVTGSVTGPANCPHDPTTAVFTLLQSWTEIDSPSPSYTCDQLIAWIRALGARESISVHDWSRVNIAVGSRIMRAIRRTRDRARDPKRLHRKQAPRATTLLVDV